MNTVQKIGVILAIGSLAATLVAPGRQTAAVTSSFWKGFTDWTRVTQGRG
jgi:hypothetical protein